MKLTCYPMTIAELCRLYRERKLDLEPPYQRRPAWKTRQREDLLESIFNGIPIPAVILFKTVTKRRRVIYEVMDGKQRIETILHFRYYRRNGKRIIPGEDPLHVMLRRDDKKRRRRLLYRDLSTPRVRLTEKIGVQQFWQYKVPVIEYSGDLQGLGGGKIAQYEVFTKINSTGSRLTKNEIRHASKSALFDAATVLEKRWRRKMVDKWRVFSKGEANRYLYHEMMLELLTIYMTGGISDKRTKLDDLMRSDTVTAQQRRRAQAAVNSAIRWAEKIVGDQRLRKSRLSRKADFYSFVGVLMKLKRDGAVSKSSSQNRAARKAIDNVTTKLARVDSRVTRYAFYSRKLRRRERELAEYIVATREGTDQLRNRTRREEFWLRVLAPCFAQRLSRRRLFSKNVKDALWIRSKVWGDKAPCPNPERRADCLRRMTYDEATVDHKISYEKGGSSDLANARLMCRVCNSGKGYR